MSIRKLTGVIAVVLGTGLFGIVPAAASPGSPAAHPNAKALYAGQPQLVDPSALYNHGRTPMYMNVAGGSCSANAAVIGWRKSDGVLYNERFNTYTVPNSGVWEFQADWCAGAGNPATGMCVADDATRYHLLHLAACNYNSKWDTFENVYAGGGVNQLYNLEYSGAVTANNSAGGQMWDGDYVFGNSDWNYCSQC